MATGSAATTCSGTLWVTRAEDRAEQVSGGGGKAAVNGLR